MRLPPLRWLLVLVLAPFPALAGESKLEPPELDRYLRWGPVRARPGLTVTNLGYDDNILVNDRQRVGDYRVTVAPRLDGLVLLGPSFLTFTERAEYTAFAENSGQNFFNHSSTGRLTVPWSRFGVFASVGLIEARERPVEREDVRRNRRERRIGAGLIWQLGWRTELELQHRRTRYRFSDEDALVDPSIDLDRVERSQRLEAAYRLGGRTRLTLDASFTDLAFDNRVERNAREFAVQPGLRLGEGWPLTGALRLGWSRVEARNATVPDLDGLVGEARLAYRFPGRTALELEFERAQHFAVTSDYRYYRLSRVGARVVHYLNRVLGVEASGAVCRLSFEGAEAAVAPRRDDLLRYGAGLRLRVSENPLGRRVEYVLRMNRYVRDSTAVFDTRRTAWGIDAVVGF